MSKKEKLIESVETLLNNLEEEGQDSRDDVENVRAALEELAGL